MEDIKNIREMFWPEFDKVSDKELLNFYILCRKVCEYVIDKHAEEKAKKKNEEKLNNKQDFTSLSSS